MTRLTNRRCRRGFTVRDLAVGVCCLLVAGSLLVSQTGATRSLSQAQVCTNNLRQMFAGLAAYVNQYNCYPPNAPYPTYMASETINGIGTGGWDPNIGFIMTHGMGLTPPRTDPTTGHFIWYGTAYADLPDVCKCPNMSPSLLDPANPELGSPDPLETLLYRYALSYMTSGTCRAATTVVRPPSGPVPGVGGRNPAIPDPTRGDMSAHPADNSQRGNPYVWVYQHTGAPDQNSYGGAEYACWVQAINPAEVQAPSRVFYLADSRDYRSTPGAWPAAGSNSGWTVGGGNIIMTSARHYGYGNALYLDGHVTRDGQMHQPQWNMDYAFTGRPTSSQWRAATFDTQVRTARIMSQVRTMPVLSVKGWEYFFDATGAKAQ